MNKTPRKYRLKLNSIDKVEELLQELYDESCENLVIVQTEMNRLTNSVNLNDECMEAKTKYAKAVNDFLVNREKAIRVKFDVGKLMSEILKYNGNTQKAFDESDNPMDWDLLKTKMDEMDNSNNKLEVYSIKPESKYNGRK